MLIVGALLMLLAGIVFAVTQDFWWLPVAATIGVISPSGNEVGPFLSIEQAEVVADRQRTAVFAWYNLVGSLATALGALAGGTPCGFRPGLSAPRWKRHAFTEYSIPSPKGSVTDTKPLAGSRM